MRARTINESEETKIPVRDITFELVDPHMVGDYSRKINIAVDGLSSRQIRDETSFGYWKEDFIEKYGDEGNVVLFHGRGNIEGNPKFDRIRDITGRGVSKYYRDKSPGGYTGD